MLHASQPASCSKELCAGSTVHSEHEGEKEASEYDHLMSLASKVTAGSSSAITTTSSASTETDHQHTELSFIVDYLGSDQLSEAQSLPIIMETLKRIKKEQLTRPTRVDFVIRDGLLRVSNVKQGALLITAPLYAVAYCAQEQLRGFDSAFAINITRKRVHMCHVFEAGSCLEASSIVRSVAVSFKSVGKLLRDRREHFKHVESSNSLRSYDSTRVRTDSEGSRGRIQIDSDDSRDRSSSDLQAGGRLRYPGSFSLPRQPKTSLTAPLPTLRSEENLTGLPGAIRVDIHSNKGLTSDSSREQGCSSEATPFLSREAVNSSPEPGFPHEQKSNPESIGRHPLVSTVTLFQQAVSAINRSDLDALQRCLDDGLSINAENQNNASLLHYAVGWNKPKIVTFLLDRGADPNWEDDKDQTPLHCSAAMGDRAITRLLLLHGANVRAKDRRFRTPLHLCAGCLQSLEVSYILVEHGARIEDNDLVGMRPVDLQMELREMQNRLIQSACEAFASSETIRSRSSSSSSSKSTTAGRSLMRPHHPSPLLPKKELKSLYKQTIARGSDGTPHSDSDGESAPLLADDQTSKKSLEPSALSTKTSSSDRVTMAAIDGENYNETDGVAKEANLSSTSYSKLFKRDPAAESLDLLVTLSANPECHASILANLCLPKASGQLVALAIQESPSMEHLEKITTLMTNMFTVAGPESRRKAVEAGLLKTVIDLLNGPEPVQGACLSILSDLLQMHSDKDYSTAISSIPLDPLLSIIQKPDSDSDLDPTLIVYNGMTRILSRQGFESLPVSYEKSPSSRRRSLLLDGSSRSSSLSKKGHSDAMRHDQHLDPGRGRSESCTSYSSRDSSPLAQGDKRLGESIAMKLLTSRQRGNVQAPPAASFPIRNTAKRIAVKMISACSTSPKLQLQLAKESVFHILLDCLGDQDQHIVLWAGLTVANILANLSIHHLLDLDDVRERLMSLLKHTDEEVCYHASRGLIYMGCCHTGEAYLFKYLEDEEKSSNFAMYSNASSTEHRYVKGATLEKLVFLLTQNPHSLWGGTSFPPPSPGTKRSRAGHIQDHNGGQYAPTELQIIRFVLTTYRSFVNPVVLARLLLHRFYHPDHIAVFTDAQASHRQRGSSSDVDSLQLPVLHMRLMRTWIMWLETFPDDFAAKPTMQDDFDDLIESMRVVGGPYKFCADKLDDLLNKIKASDSASVESSKTSEDAASHHDVLYEQCQKAILSGALPCTEDDFVYLAGLHLYIEDLCDYGSLFLRRVLPHERVTPNRLKQCIHPSAASSKYLLKRIRNQYEVFMAEMPTERNAKHNYIDCCQGLPGYGCKFFKLKLYLPGRSGRKGVSVQRLLGIGSRRITVLDEKTKACLQRWAFKDLRLWDTTQDDLTLDMAFKNDRLRFQLDNKSVFKELTNLIFTCTTEMKWSGLNGLETTPWSELAEETGSWGSHALQLYLQKSKRDMEQSPSGTRCVANRMRERAATINPMCDRRFSKSPLRRAQSYASRPVSRSAPSKEEGGLGSYLSDWLPFGSGRKSGDRLEGREVAQPRPSVQAASVVMATPTSQQADDDMMPNPRVRRPRTLSISQEEPTTSHAQGGGKQLSPIDEKTPLSEIDSKMLEMERGDCPVPPSSRIRACTCPPDADLPNLNRKDFSAFELLQHSKELARQITLIDHTAFRKMTARNIQERIFDSCKRPRDNEAQTTVEIVAQRFNQLSNWVTYSIVSEKNIERRAELIKNFIETGKQCLELKNYNAVTAVVVAALGSAPVRRLAATRQLVMEEYLTCQSKMEGLMDTKHNYKKYREALRTSPTPAVPYFGLYLKDLTFIADGNPDLLRGGLINVNKRRQVYVLLLEIRRFQGKIYNFQEVPEIRHYLLSRPFVSEDDLHRLSREVEPSLPARLTSLSVASSSHSTHFTERRPSIGVSKGVPMFKTHPFEKTSNRKGPGKQHRLNSMQSER